MHRGESIYEGGWSKAPADLIIPEGKMQANEKCNIWGNSLDEQTLHGARVFSQAARESQSLQSFRFWLEKALRNLMQFLNDAFQ